MNAFELFAKLTLDTSGFDSGLAKAKSMGSTLGSGLKTAMDVGIKAVAGATAAVGAFAASSVKTGMEFDKSMSQVAATMGLSMSEMEQSIGSVDTAYGKFSGNLRDYAQFMGANTAFSAKQAADALNYMALAGYDAQTSMDMLPNVLNLAAAGNMELATASDMVTDAQSALGLSLEETNVMVDQMAMASSKSNTSVAQLGEAILTVGGTAKDLSGGTAELSTALGILANAGIKGAEGGTALRNILLSLTPKSEDAAKAMEMLGFNAYDADGNLRPLDDTFKDLAISMKDLSTQERTQLLANIFNKVDLKSVNALMAQSVDGIDKLSYTLQASSVDWEKYSSEPWMQGKNAMFEFATQVGYNLVDMGMSVAETAEFISSEYDMTLEDATAAVQSIDTALAESGSTWESLEDNILNAQGAAQKMADTQLDNLAGDITLLQSAFEGLQIAVSEGGTGALREFVQMATDGLSRVTQALKSGGTDAAIEVFSEWLSEALTQIVNGMPKFIDAGMKLLGSLGQGILNNLPIMLQAATQALNMFLQGVMSAIPSLLEGAAQIVEALGTFLIENIPSLMESAVQLVINLANFIGQNADKTVDGVIALIVAINEAFYKNIPQIIPAIVEMVAQIALAIITHIPDVIVAIVRLYTDMIQAIWESKEQFFTAVTDILSSILESIVDYGLQMLNIVSNNIEFLKLSVEDGMSTMFNNIISWLEQLPPKMAYYAGYAVGEFIRFVAELPSKASEIFQNVIAKTVEFLTDFVNKAVQGAKDFFDAIVNGLKDLPSRMTQFGRDLVDSIKDLPDKFLDIGGNIVKGLWKGISDGWSWLEEQVGNLVDSLVAGVEDALGIASPSKVFKKIGYWVDAGFGDGIKNNSELVTNPMKNLTESLISIPNIDAFDSTLEYGTNDNTMTSYSGMGYTQIINITSPIPLSPYEVGRQTRNATRDMVLSMRKG